MKVASMTDPGRVRKNNEDSLFVDGRLGLLIVADGMGGHNGGEVASRIAVDTISGLIAAQLATTALDALTGRPVITAPNVWHVDARKRRSSIYRPRRWRFLLSVLRARLSAS